LAQVSRSDGGLFAVGGDVFGWDDAVALAKLRGEWGRLAEQVREGLAALAVLEARGEGPTEEEVDAAGRQFRYERDLLAADELADWLERHRLSVEDWQAYLARQLAREKLSGADRSVVEEDVDAVVWAEGVCSGRLEELTLELAARAAVSPGAPLERLDPAFEEFCAAAVDAAAVAREVETNRLEWLRFRYDAVVAEDEGAAQELVLCVRADGDSLAAAADRARLELLEDDCWLDEVEPALAARLLAAKTGELVGPVAIEDGYVVAHVIEKTDPSLEDDTVRERAHEAAVKRAVSRVVAERVVWL
jgi:hypothetical protein